MTLLIKNGRIVTATDDFIGDILVDGETISRIGPSLSASADETIDATDRLVIPGGIDPHTHLDMPMGSLTSSDDYETGTRAAAFGGTTTIIDFPTQQRGHSMFEALEDTFHRAEGKACIDYGFHMIVTDLSDGRESELRRLANEGIPSFKLFMAYPDRLYVDDGTLYRAMREAGENGAVIMMHAENGIVIDEIVKRARAEGNTAPIWHARTRPVQMEAEAVFRSVCIAEVAGAPLYIVHLSSAAALEQVNLARARNLPVFAETCPQYLFLDESLYERDGFEGAKWVMTPALRAKGNQEALWQGLSDDTLQTVGTDHCPFCMKDKELGREDFSKIPNGAPGIENRMSLIYDGGVASGRFDLKRFVEVTSTNAARIFGLYPKKGALAPGSDADIVIFDTNREETISINNPRMHHMRVDYSAYEGTRVRGYAETVISRGKIICRNGEFLGKPGAGRFLKRNKYSS